MSRTYRWRTTVDTIDTVYGEKLQSAGDKINTFMMNLSSDWYQFVNTFHDASCSQSINVKFSQVDSTVFDYLTGEWHPDWQDVDNLIMDKYDQVPVDLRLQLFRWYFEPYLMQQKAGSNSTARVLYMDSSTGLYKFANNRALYNNYSDTTGVIGNIYPLNANTPLSGSFDLIINGLFYDYGNPELKPGEIYYLTDDLDGWLIPYSEGGKKVNLSIPFAIPVSPIAALLLTDRAITKDLPCIPECPSRGLIFASEIVPSPTPTPTYGVLECTQPRNATCDNVSLQLQPVSAEQGPNVAGWTSTDVVNKSPGPDWTINGSVVYDTAKPLFTTGGALFNGTNGYLSVPHQSSLPVALGDDEFTIEFWMHPKSQPTNTCILNASKNVQDNSNSWGWMVLYTGGRLFFVYSTTGVAGTGTNNSWKFVIDALVPVINTWNHVVFTRANNMLRGYLNGMLIDEADIGTDIIFDPGMPLEIGRRDSADYYNGYLQGLRISDRSLYEGQCYDMPTGLLPEAQSVPVQPNPSFLLYQPRDQNSIFNVHLADEKTAPSTITPSVSHVATPDAMNIGSAEFSNGGAVVVNNTLSASAFLQDSTNEYTIECYVRTNSIASGVVQTIWSEVFSSAHVGAGVYIHPDSNGVHKFAYVVFKGTTGAGAVSMYSNTTPVANRWYHVVITNDGAGTLKMYIDGKLDQTATWNHQPGSNTTFPIHIGVESNGNWPLSGNIQSLRISDHVVYPADSSCIDYMKQPDIHHNFQVIKASGGSAAAERVLGLNRDPHFAPHLLIQVASCGWHYIQAGYGAYGTQKIYIDGVKVLDQQCQRGLQISKLRLVNRRWTYVDTFVGDWWDDSTVNAGGAYLQGFVDGELCVINSWDEPSNAQNIRNELQNSFGVSSPHTSSFLDNGWRTSFLMVAIKGAPTHHRGYSPIVQEGQANGSPIAATVYIS